MPSLSGAIARCGCTQSTIFASPMKRIAWTGPARGIYGIHAWEFLSAENGVRVHTEESWSGEVVHANAASFPLLDGALNDWLTRLKRISEGRRQKIAP